MKKTIKRFIATSCLLAMMVNLTGCGYLLYPERKGMSGGRLDPVVVLLDGAGLLFGILPGVVAFAVDITNGTIYLPRGASSAIDRHLSSVGSDEFQEVIDQQGQEWIQVPVSGLAAGAAELPQLGSALSEVTGRQVAVQDIVWLDNLADSSRADALVN